MKCRSRRRTTLGLGTSLVALAGMALATAWAGPPYVTDDPETPALHGWEINIPFILTNTLSSSTRNIPLFDVNYGFRENVQLKLEVPIVDVHQRPSGSESATGVGDTLVGVKWRLLEQKKALPDLAAYPQIGLPTGDSDRGLGTGSYSWILPLLVQKNWGKWAGFGNAGYVAQTASGSRDYGYYGVAVSRQLGERLDAGAELFGNTPTTRSSTSDLGFNLGTEWTFHEGRALLAAVGRGLRNGVGTMAYAGLQMQFGPVHRHHRRKAPREAHEARGASAAAGG